MQTPSKTQSKPELFRDPESAQLTESLRSEGGAGRDLRGANLRDAQLAGVDLSGADLSGVDLSGADLSDALLFRANLAGANLHGTQLDRAELSGCLLENAVLEDASAVGAGFGQAKLAGATLCSADMRGAVFSGADLSGADLTAATLARARLRETNLTHAILVRADLHAADLSGANLYGAHLERADMREVRLHGILGFAHASWHGVDIRNADFNGAYILRRHVIDENFLHEFRQQGPLHRSLYTLWLLTSDCGRSILRWGLWVICIACMFGLAYTQVELDYGDHVTSISAFYFSVVTLTTLGYGDVTPVSVAAQLIVMAEVFTGYVMLGGLLSIFANKMARRG